jgi:tetratricopeptide (TPR) repeat protein
VATIFDRLSGKLGGILDDVTLPERQAKMLADAERFLASGDAWSALAALDTLDRERPGLWRSASVRGMALHDVGDFQRAAETLRIALERRDSASLRLYLGRSLERLGDAGSARSQYEQALAARVPDDLRFELLLAVSNSWERAGEPARALGSLRQAHRMRPNDESLLVRYARALRSNHERDAAIEVLDAALAMEPAPIDALILVGTELLSRNRDGDVDHAAACFQRILDRSPDNADGLEGLARTRLQTGKFEEAQALFVAALATARVSQRTRIQRWIGECLVRTARDAEALEPLREAVSRDPTNVETLRILSGAALRLGLTDEAEKAARLGLDSASDDTVCRANLGRVLVVQQKIEEARRVLHPLRRLRHDGYALLALGELAHAAGETVEAIAMFREAANYAPELTEIEGKLRAAYDEIAPKLPPLGALDELGPAKLSPFLEALGHAVAAHPVLQDLLPRATALRRHVDEPLSVAVLGEFNAGKSTFINAFVGEEMVATGVLPTTNHINVVRFGPRKTALLTTHDGTTSEISYAEASRLVKQAPESIGSLDFCFPNPDLRAIHFWDTPGMNAPDELHEERAKTALQTADAIVWLIDMNQALSGTEFARLQQVSNRTEKLLVAINKIDRFIGPNFGENLTLENSPEIAEVRAHVEKGLGGGCVGVFPISALRTLDLRKRAEGASAAELSAIGWQDFEQTLRQRVFDRAGRLKSLEVARNLQELTCEVLSRAELGQDRVSRSRDNLAQMRKALELAEKTWDVVVAGDAVTLAARQLQETRSRAWTEIAQAAVPGDGLFARRAVSPDERLALRSRIVDWCRVAFSQVHDLLVAAAAAHDARLLETAEKIATEIGSTEARTVRSRMDAFGAEIAALKLLLGERLLTAPLEIVSDRMADFGDLVIDAVASGSLTTEAERDAQLRRVVPSLHEHVGEKARVWGAQYFAAARSLCDQLSRDLDILSIDLERRIVQPFREVERALGGPQAASSPASSLAFGSSSESEVSGASPAAAPLLALPPGA